MKDLVLAVNAGSSSIKVALLQNEDHLLHAVGERLGTEHSSIHLDFSNEDDTIDIAEANMDHKRALKDIIDALKERSMLDGITAIGHRVVHGGTLFSDSTLVDDDDVIDRIESISNLAPLHNPANLAGIRLMREILPNVHNVAVFDTSFHTTIPEKAFTYPLPRDYREAKMRKFGFHGTSVKFVSLKAKEVLDEKKKNNASDQHNIIVCHLGSGASVTAVVGGESRDTSMGFTPLAGLMMGTRCGSVDPSIVGFACEELDKSVDDVMTDFNQRSGLSGMVDGQDYDMRALLKRQDEDDDAKLAVEMFVYRLAQHIAAAMVALGGPLDALVFTAGIGEHSAEIRRRTMQALAPILPTAQLDEKRNSQDGSDSQGILSAKDTWPLLLDIPTDEEAMIALESLRVTDSAK